LHIFNVWLWRTFNSKTGLYSVGCNHRCLFSYHCLIYFDKSGFQQYMVMYIHIRVPNSIQRVMNSYFISMVMLFLLCVDTSGSLKFVPYFQLSSPLARGSANVQPRETGRYNYSIPCKFCFIFYHMIIDHILVGLIQKWHWQQYKFSCCGCSSFTFGHW